MDMKAGVTAIIFAAVSAVAAAAAAEEAKSPETAARAAAGAAEEKPKDSEVTERGSLADHAVLTPEEKAEKESRKVCKIEICAAFRNPNATGHDMINCDIIKSWRKTQLIKLVGRMKVKWPYGPVRCTTALKLKRGDLAKAMKEQKHQSQLEKHAVHCEVDREKEPAAEIKFEFAPKVSFEKGKAVSAQVNWGKIEAPTLIKGAMWTATAADNTVNLLSGTLVEDINEFITKKCDEVKEDAADE